jgi:RsiW-degrading membrane proteinase PrsW (M82 family)
MVCPKCGTECLPEHRFCKSCGVFVGSGEPPQVASTQMPGVQSVPQAAPGAAPTYYFVPVQTTAQQQSTHGNLLEGLRLRIQRLASTEALEGFSLKEMFSDVFKRRTAQEVEDYILVGTSKTTPPIDVVETGWPKPWLFFRLLAALLVAYVALTFLFIETGNSNCVPGIMFLGAFAVPWATLVLFFELNTPRNVSLHMVGKLFLLGAIVSLAVALLGYSMPIFKLSDMEAGIVEELAKLLTVVAVMRSVRYKYILNGILFGATVGAGFAAFETAGYALNQGLLPGLFHGLVQYNGDVDKAMNVGTNVMLSILRIRGIETPLAHIPWTAIAAGAFWRAKLDKPTSPAMLFDTRFLKAFIIPVVLHAIWDAPIQLPFHGNQFLTGIVTWYVIFGLVQQGLRQVKEEQKAHLISTLQSVEASIPASGAAMA